MEITKLLNWLQTEATIAEFLLHEISISQNKEDREELKSRRKEVLYKIDTIKDKILLITGKTL